MKKDIYIIKNTINDKCYIGQSVNYRKRFKKHCETAKQGNYTYKSCLYNAMRELGIENFYVEPIEEQIEDYNKKERFYIKKFKTLRPFGYNIAEGGDWYPHLSGIEHHHSSIKTIEDLEDIYNDLICSELNLSEIAKKHNLPFWIIQKINSGETYYNYKFVYPLKRSILSKSQLDRLTYDLKYSNYSYSQLATNYNISLSQVKAINSGRSWNRKYLIYPLRTSVFRGEEKEIEKIQKDLMSTSASFKELSKKYKCSENTICRINQGETHKNLNLTYPLRKTGKISSEDVLKIHNKLLENELSIREIAKQYSVSDATIKRINSGATKKYILNNFTYPLR